MSVPVPRSGSILLDFSYANPKWPAEDILGGSYNLFLTVDFAIESTYAMSLSPQTDPSYVTHFTVAPGSTTITGFTPGPPDSNFVNGTGGSFVWTISNIVYSFVFTYEGSNLFVQSEISVDGALQVRDMLAPDGVVLSSGKVEVPTVLITGDFFPGTIQPATASFIISDSISHRCPQPSGCCSERVEKIPSTQVISTVFTKQVDLIPVLRGKGVTYQEKVGVNLYNTENVDSSLTRIRFMQRVVSYGLVRYVLSYLLYGIFDTKYLLQSYYCQFLQDLKVSRYCRFKHIFRGSIFRGYEKYYLE
jgi:hypothetical protein